MSTVSSTGTLSVASGFIADAHDEQLARRHPALDTAGEGRVASVRAGGLVPADGVVGGAAASGGDVEAVAELDALDGLDAHHRLGEQAVELAIPVDVAAEPDGHAVGEHLDHPAERVAVLGGRLDLRDHRLGAAGIEAAHRRVVDRARGRRESAVTAELRASPICTTWEMTSMPIVRSSSLATAPAATRAAVSLALARSSTSRASSNPYFCIPARSAWPGRTWVSGASVAPGAGDISACHLSLRFHSVLAISMATGDPSVRPWRTPPMQRQLVDLEALARPAAEAEPAPGQLALDVLDGDGQAGRQTFDDDHEPLAVGLSRSQEPQHRPER